MLLAFQRIFIDGRMLESMSVGLVCLIPKGGDKQEAYCSFVKPYKALANKLVGFLADPDLSLTWRHQFFLD